MRVLLVSANTERTAMPPLPYCREIIRRGLDINLWAIEGSMRREGARQ